MKLVTAVIEPSRVDQVKEALKAAGVTGITATKVDGFGRPGTEEKVFRGSRYTVDFHPKARLEMVLADRETVERVVNVLAAATAGAPDDGGKVWVTDVEWVVNLRTGASNADAV